MSDRDSLGLERDLEEVIIENPDLVDTHYEPLLNYLHDLFLQKLNNPENLKKYQELRSLIEMRRSNSQEYHRLSKYLEPVIKNTIRVKQPNFNERPIFDLFHPEVLTPESVYFIWKIYEMRHNGVV